MTEKTRGFVILAVVAALIGGVIGLGTALFNTSPQVARAASVYEAPIGAVGPDAFSPSFATGQLPESYEFTLESGEVAASSESLYVQPRGTYGGPGSNVCDTAGMKAFFERNPDRAAAWARIQGIAFAEIGSFIDSLNTAYLAQNVKLTMYGFKNGQEYGYEAIIAAGTAVLVDDQGLPRVRCACGNPLVTDEPPEETTTTVEETTTTVEETTTTVAETTTTVPFEIEECPEGTTYYRDEDGNPVTPEPTIEEWVEIDSSDGGFNPTPLDEETEQTTDQWEATYDLCAPECPEYDPEEGEIYNDSWRYEDGRWVPLFGDYAPIYDTRLLPGWAEDCGPCPPDDPGTYDAAPPTRRYEGEYYTWDFETEQWIDANGEPGDLPDQDAALDDPLDINGDGLDPEYEQELEDEFGDEYDPCEPECPPDYYDDVPSTTVPNDDSSSDDDGDDSSSSGDYDDDNDDKPDVGGTSSDNQQEETKDDTSSDETEDDPYVPGGDTADSSTNDENSGDDEPNGDEPGDSETDDPCEPECPPDYSDDSTPGDNGDGEGSGYYEDGEYYDPYDDDYRPGGYDDSDPCTPCPPDFNNGYPDDGYYDDGEYVAEGDGYYNDYDPCVPRCPIDVYLSMLPTYFVDPAGFSWSFDSVTGLWTPSNGGAPQNFPPPWIQDLLDAYLVAYDPDSPCLPPPLCPNPAGTPLSRYVLDRDGVLWTWASGKWYSQTGEVRELISEFPDCSPCPAELDGRDIWQYYDSSNYRWFRDAQGLWWRADDSSGEKFHIWEIPGYVEHCGSQDCPDDTSALGSIYIDPNGAVWEYDGEGWEHSAEDGALSYVIDIDLLPGCDNDEQPFSTDQPVSALIACTYNLLTDTYQMRALLEGEVSRVHGVFDDVPPNTRYSRVGNLFFRTFDQRPTGVVRLVINMGPTSPAVFFNHDVADCRQPLPGTEDGEFQIELASACGYVPTARLWQIQLTALNAGRPATDVLSVVEVRDGTVYQRIGNTYVRTLPDIELGSFYVRVTLYNGSFNEILIDTDGCDDVMTGEWGRINMYARCEWNAQLTRNELHLELAGETSNVWQVRTPREPGAVFTRVAEPRNHWYRVVNDVQSLMNAAGEITVEVTLFDGSAHYFSFEPDVTVSGRCTTNAANDFPEGYEFGLTPNLGCSTDNNGNFVVVVGMSSVLNSRPELTVADIRKVSDSTNPNRYYAPTGVQFVGVWNPPPGAQDGTWITIKLFDGRSNQYLLTFHDCETVPILETITSPLTSEEEQEDDIIIIDPTTTTAPPRIVTPETSTTVATPPATSTSTTTTTTAPPTTTTSTTTTTTTTTTTVAPTTTTTSTTTTTTTLPNVDPVISNLALTCTRIPGSNGYTANFSVTATDENGDPLVISIQAVDSADDPLTVTPGSAAINSGETASFSFSFEFTNLYYTITVTDGREGTATQNGIVGSDYEPYCN